MRYAYPAADGLPNSQPDHIQTLRISRHSPCSECSCHGLHPEPDAIIVLDTDREVLGDDTDDDDGARRPYLDSCACGHGPDSHGADLLEVERAEFLRRSRVAGRIDEGLHALGRLRDFNYVDPDIKSLRKQMHLPLHGLHSSPSTSRASSVLTDPDQPPPPKRRRLSPAPSSLSGASDEDDQPLASRIAPGSLRNGKKPTGHKTKAATAPISIPPPTGRTLDLMNGVTNGTPKPSPTKKAKLEEKLDQGQIDRLTTGVTVDTTKTSVRAKALVNTFHIPNFLSAWA